MQHLRHCAFFHHTGVAIYWAAETAGGPPTAAAAGALEAADALATAWMCVGAAGPLANRRPHRVFVRGRAGRAAAAPN